LIGEIAQLRGSENSSEENKKIINALETQLREVQAEISELKRDFGRKERDFQLVVEELSMLKVERDRRERAFELERGRITDELNDAHFEMEKLQKQICNKPQNEDTSEASGLIEKLEALENELQEKDDLLREMTESNDELGRSLSETSSRLDHVQIEYAQLSDKFKSGSKSSNESEAELRYDF
jgi:chromosome segregation ATPase